ncbi:MAG: hypothetical protein ILM98_05980 [Kiritimatiellae bacterium]|nr:hypothetical protein [Kiritimatiellia bacterium]
MSEMSHKEVAERLDGYRARRAARRFAAIAAIVVVVVAAVGVTMRMSAAHDAAIAEKARVESILQKPLLEWSEAERAEFPEEYENRRQKERAMNPALWTAAEKKTEWWRYSKLLLKSKLRRRK